MSAPASVIRPDSMGSMPMIASTSSAWPLPSTPARPTISPRWMTRLTSSTTARPPADGDTVTFSTTSSGVSVTVDSRSSGTGSSLPTISSAS